MTKYENFDYCFFEKIKKNFRFRNSFEFYEFFDHFDKRFDFFEKITNETSIKINEIYKNLYFFEIDFFFRREILRANFSRVVSFNVKLNILMWLKFQSTINIFKYAFYLYQTYTRNFNEKIDDLKFAIIAKFVWYHDFSISKI